MGELIIINIEFGTLHGSEYAPFDTTCNYVEHSDT